MSAYALPGRLFSSFTNSSRLTKLHTPPTTTTPDTSTSRSSRSTRIYATTNEPKNITPSKNQHLIISIESATIDPIRLIQSYDNQNHNQRHNHKSLKIGNHYDNDDNNKNNDSPNIVSYNVYTSDDNEENCWGEFCDADSFDDENENKNDNSDCNDVTMSLLNLNQNNDDRHNHDHHVSTATTSTTKRTTTNLYKNNTHTTTHTHIYPNLNNTNNHNPLNKDAQNILQNDAIIFTLSIQKLKVNGQGNDSDQKFRAKRSLLQFIKFRNEFVKEMNNMKMYVDEKGENNNDDDKNNHSLKNDDNTMIIPELPMINSGSGFAGLQNAVIAICPLMELWLQKIIQLITDSSTCATSAKKSFDNFLWEPSLHQVDHNNKMKKNKVNQLNSVLEGIERVRTTRVHVDVQKITNSKTYGMVMTNNSSSSIINSSFTYQRRLSSLSSKRLSMNTLNSISEDFDDSDD